MKTVLTGAGMVCAVAASVAAQQGNADLGGPLGQYDVELTGSNGYFINFGGVPVSQTEDISRQATLAVPQFWEDFSFDGLSAGAEESRSSFESFIESEPTELSGRLDIRAEARSSFDNAGASTRLFHELNIAVPDLDTVADVEIRLDANANATGFGRSTLSYLFESDEFSEQGMIRDDLNGGLSVFFESVRLTSLDIRFTARTEASTDSPVTNAQADLAMNWAVEIVPIPAPSSAAGLAAFGLLAARRRREPKFGRTGTVAGLRRLNVYGTHKNAHDRGRRRACVGSRLARSGHLVRRCRRPAGWGRPVVGDRV